MSESTMLRLCCRDKAALILYIFWASLIGAPNQSIIHIHIFLHLSLLIISFSICPALKQEGEEKTEENCELFKGIVPDIKSVNKID